jgi:hypothetical protein
LASANGNLSKMVRKREEASKPECRFKSAEQAHPSLIPARTEKWGNWSKSQGPRRIAPEKISESGPRTEDSEVLS